MADHSTIDISVKCMPRIPKFLIAKKPTDYVPQKVSLGPFHHHSNTELDHYQDSKSRLPRARFGFGDEQFKKLMDNMKQDEIFIGKIRESYYAPNDISPSERELGRMNWYYAPCDSSPNEEILGRMMAIDGFFLLQFLREFDEVYVSNLMDLVTRFGDDVFKPLQQSVHVQKDIVKLENQIPIFVLEKILQWERATIPAGLGPEESTLQDDRADRVIRSKTRDGDVHELIRSIKRKIRDRALNPCHSLNSTLDRAWKKMSPFPSMPAAKANEHVALHLLEFVYKNIVRSGDRSPTLKKKKNCTILKILKEENNAITLPSAVELRRKGVTFAADVKFLNEIRFDETTKTFHLPKTEISYETAVLMENLVAFEATLTRNDGSKQLKRYVDLMDNLNYTSADARVLIQDGIINDIVQPEEVASAWKSVGKGLDKGNYEPIDTAVDDVQPLLMRSAVKELYIPKIYVLVSAAILVVSFLIAVIALGFTVWQTKLSLEQVHLQKESMKIG